VLETGKSEVRANMVIFVVSDIENVAIASRRSIRLSIVCSAFGNCEGGVHGVDVSVNVGNGLSSAEAVTRQRGSNRECNCAIVSWCLRRVRRARNRLYGGTIFFWLDIGGGGCVRRRWFCRCA
jgi:hypothetical protein